MGTGYTRNDTVNNIADGNIINASDIDGEYDALQAAFDAATGHTHDGTAGEGAPIEVTGPAQEYVSTGTEFRPKANNTYDLGSSGNQWKDLYVDGTANLDAVDIDGGNIDGTVIGAASAAAGTFTTATATTGNITTVNATTVDTTNIEVTNIKAKDGTAAGSIADATGVVTLASSVLTTTDINGGTIDGTTIGGASAAAGTFTNVTANGTINLAGATVSNGGTVTTVDINGGTIDGTVIGGSTPAAISGTTGSFSGNLTVDTNTLFVDASNNRVGIVTSSPATQLEVVGTIRASGGGPRLSILDTGGATDEKEWSLSGSDGPLRLFAINEAGGGSGDYVDFTRVGNSVRTIRGARSGNTSYELSNFDRSLFFSGGVSTIGTATAHDLVVDTNNTERMRITSAGRVGIGTSSPTTALHVNASSGLRVSGSTGNFFAGDNLNLLDAGTLNSGAVYFGTVDTTNPTAGIEASWGGATLPQIHIGITRDGNKTRYSAFLDNTLRMYTGDSERLRITSTGSVGIGTSSPASKFVVSGGRTDLTANSETYALGVRYSSGTGIYYIGASNSATPDLVFSQVGGSERVRFTNDGNVGIGTSSPAQKLVTYAASTNLEILNTVRNDNAGVGIAAIGFNVSASGEGDFTQAGIGFVRGIANGGGALAFYNKSDGATGNFTTANERMRIDASGKLLLGTSSTFDNVSFLRAQFLDGLATKIDSTLSTSQVSFFNPNGRVGHIATSGTSTSYITSSDYRLKENVVPLVGAASRLAQIPVHRFNFIADPDTVVDGFLAHEVQAFVPECVTGEKDAVDKDGKPVHQGIDQSKLVPLLTAALQEALTEIADLKARVAALEA